jgi:hypothetical protein
MFKVLEFIRYRVMYQSTKFKFLERKLIGRETDTPFELLIGMVSNEERNYCYRYAKNEYTGTGELVDLGSWLGASVAPLATGLKENRYGNNHKIHVYDTFIWYENMTASAWLSSIQGKYNVGDNFRAEFEKQISPFNDVVEIHEGDLEQLRWNGKPIEYLMVDVMKTWELAKHVVKEYYPSLIPGKSIVIHQDFCHNYTSWIHLIQYRLREYFEPVKNIRHSGSMVFRNTKQLPASIAEIPEALNDFTYEEVENAFAYSLSMTEPENKAAVKAAKVMMYRHLGDYKEARKQMDKISAWQKWMNYDLRDTDNVLRTESN